MQINVDKTLDQLKKAWDENPLQVIAIGSMAVMAATKFLNAATWRREVRRREYNSSMRRR